MERSPRKINIGDRFGRLTVIDNDGEYVSQSKKIYKYKCKCDCGNVISIREDALLSGYHKGTGTKSCGCLTAEVNTKHGLGSNRIYNEYRKMVDRCTKPNSKQKDIWNEE